MAGFDRIGLADGGLGHEVARLEEQLARLFEAARSEVEERLGRAREEAERIVAQARDDARAIVEQARDEAEDLLAPARQHRARLIASLEEVGDALAALAEDRPAEGALIPMPTPPAASLQTDVERLAVRDEAMEGLLRGLARDDLVADLREHHPDRTVEELHELVADLLIPPPNGPSPP